MEVSRLFIKVEVKRIEMRMSEFPFLLELLLMGNEVATTQRFQTAMLAIKYTTIRSRKAIEDKNKELEDARELVEEIQFDVIKRFNYDLGIIGETLPDFTHFVDYEGGSVRPGPFEPTSPEKVESMSPEKVEPMSPEKYETISPGPFEPMSPGPYEPISPGPFVTTATEPGESTFQGSFEATSPTPYVFHQYYETDGQSSDSGATSEGPIYTKNIVPVRSKDSGYFNDQGQWQSDNSEIDLSYGFSPERNPIPSGSRIPDMSPGMLAEFSKKVVILPQKRVYTENWGSDTDTEEEVKPEPRFFKKFRENSNY